MNAEDKKKWDDSEQAKKVILKLYGVDSDAIQKKYDELGIGIRD